MSFKQYLFIAIFTYITCFIYYIDFSNELPTLNFSGVEFFKYYGYNGEEHVYVSEDGFETKIHRLGHGGNGRKVLILIPGIHCTSEVLFALGPKHDIPYTLYDIGFDVWITNVRGTLHTKPVENKNFTDNELTNFSFHEQGYYDLSAAIDYIQNVTGQKKVVIYGCSAGAIATQVLLASRPEYNEKIEKMIFLSPPGPFTKVTNFYQKKIIDGLTINKALSDYIMSTSKYRAQLTHVFCTHPLMLISCFDILDWFLGFHYKGLTHAEAAVVTNKMWTGPYMGLYEHFLQVFNNKNYFMRDFGSEKNLQIYGIESPPLYKISNIKVPTIILFAKDDKLFTPDAGVEMAEFFPSLKKIVFIKPPFKHTNFLTNNVFCKEFVDEIIKALHEEL